MMNNTLSVSEFSFYVSRVISNETLLKNVNVVGEISSFNVSGNIAYFSLKDTNALLQCILFNANKYYTPKTGDKIIVTGSPDYYIKGGRFSFNATDIKPFGVGDLFKKFEDLSFEKE